MTWAQRVYLNPINVFDLDTKYIYSRDLNVLKNVRSNEHWQKNCWNVIIGLVTAKEINSLYGLYFISAKTINWILIL